MAKNYEDYVLPDQNSLWITGLPLKTRFGFVKPTKIKSYSKYGIEFELLKLQGFEIKDIIRKECRGTTTEELTKEILDSTSFLELVRTNFWSLKDRYKSAFGRFIDNFDEKNFWLMQQTEFDELRELILAYNGIQYYKKSQDPDIERFNIMERIMKKQKSAGGIEFDAVYALLMTSGGHKPHDINDFTVLQFYSAFSSIQNQKNHDATILFKTVDPKVEIVEYFQSLKAKEDGIVYKDMAALKNNAPVKL